MKLLFDQNLSPKLVDIFIDSFDDCQHLQIIGFGELDDLLVWEYAKINGYTIVSKDSDFNNLVSHLGFPPKVIWLRRGNCSTKIIIEIIKKHEEVIKSFISDSKNGILTLL
ncbi:DUF5615 family PIN-like protein [Draconibacterium sp.]|jgi:predicted nuclease of predicted toxin-antitoxin system